jgi:hypothetical protein
VLLVLKPVWCNPSSNENAILDFMLARVLNSIFQPARSLALHCYCNVAQYLYLYLALTLFYLC